MHNVDGRRMRVDHGFVTERFEMFDDLFNKCVDVLVARRIGSKVRVKMSGDLRGVTFGFRHVFPCRTI